MKDRMKVDKVRKTEKANPTLMRLAQLTALTHSDQLPDKGPGKVNEETTITKMNDNVVLKLGSMERGLMECGFVLDRRYGWLIWLPHYKQLRAFTMNDIPAWDIEEQRWLCPPAIVGLSIFSVIRWIFETGLGGICIPPPCNSSDGKDTNAEGGKS